MHWFVLASSVPSQTRRSAVHRRDLHGAVVKMAPRPSTASHVGQNLAGDRVGVSGGTKKRPPDGASRMRRAGPPVRAGGPRRKGAGPSHGSSAPTPFPAAPPRPGCRGATGRAPGPWFGRAAPAPAVSMPGQATRLGSLFVRPILRGHGRPPSLSDALCDRLLPMPTVSCYAGWRPTPNGLRGCG